MRKGKLIGKIFGVALVLVMIVVLVGGLPVLAGGVANLSYNISDGKQQDGGGLGWFENVVLQPASAVLEIPLTGTVVEPENTAKAQAGWQNIMTEDFEGAFPTGLWAAFDNDGAINGEYYWDDDDYKPHWGSWSAWCANGGTDGLDPEFYYYPNDMKSWMVYGPFSLADATDGEVNYYFWLDSEYDYDFLDCEASIDGTHFYGYGWTGYTDGWVADSFDLTNVDTLGNLCGQPNVWIAFIFESDESNTGDGAFIDDIELRKYVAGALLPHIDSLSPNEGPVDARVVISGSDFGSTQGASAVTFGGVNADVSTWSDTEIVAWVPEGASSNVVVYTSQGDSNAVPFTVTDSPVDYWAVIVGVADYPGTEDDLRFPDEDAWDVHDALLAGPNWEEGHITMLLNSGATKTNIHNAITQMGSNGDGNDLFFFYYSGHGGNYADQPPIDETDGLDEFLAQYDFATDPIWDDELAEWLAALPSRKVAVSLDACYSGGQVKASSEDMVRGMATESIPSRGDGFVRDIDDIIGGVALAASAEDELSWEDSDLQNGLYTYYFVEGLGGPADSNADDKISMEEAFNYLDPRVSGYPSLQPQNPQMYDGYPDELVILLSELNNPPQLSSPSVQPPSGTPATSFYYYVNYFDSDGDSPSVKQVYIDGLAYTMSLYSGSASNGVYRYGPKNLSAGSHNYYFYFEDGEGGTARLPSSGSYSGPSVSWGELNPDFEASPREGDAPLEVNFDPSLTMGGVAPYVRAEWDFNDDGVLDLIVEDPTGVLTMAPVTHTYPTVGIYTVCLTIFDSSNPALIHTECKIEYIRVTSEEENNPPNTPSSPSPANHATSVSINADLSWTGGDPDAGDMVTYDVYFGTSSTPPLVSNDQLGTTYDPGTLAYTKYYWKVITTDNHGASTTGPLWDFSTVVVPGATATRTILDASVEPGAQFNVGIVASGCGFAGQVRETLPAGFNYVSCSDPDICVTIVGQEVRFTILGDSAEFSYTVQAPAEGDTYTFSGVVLDQDQNQSTVGGDTSVTVGDPWVYDENSDGIIQKSEALQAVLDYFDGLITKAQVLEVLLLYFS